MITLSHIHKSYGSHEVLKDVNLHVDTGEIYGLIGKNGAGKTTIFKIILGLTDFERGTVSIAESGTTAELQKNRRKIGFFIGKNFFDYLTAEENLHYYRQLKGIKDRNEVQRVLEHAGLQGVNTTYGSFSMGMKQRLGIADIRNLIIRLNHDQNKTIIISSHILGELEHTANKFGIVHQGHIVREITHEDLKAKRSTVEISIEALEKVRCILKKHNVPILQETSEYKSLEDYYFELVGGTDNV